MSRTIAKGDVLGLLMEETGLSGDGYVGAFKALKKHVDPTDIKPGHKIEIINERLGQADTIKSISYIYDGLKSVQLSKNNEQWSSQIVEQQLDIKTRGAVATIENSIYGSMGKAGVPDGIINKMIKAYSWTVDFQRDIWGGEEVDRQEPPFMPRVMALCNVQIGLAVTGIISKSNIMIHIQPLMPTFMVLPRVSVQEHVLNKGKQLDMLDQQGVPRGRICITKCIKTASKLILIPPNYHWVNS